MHGFKFEWSKIIENLMLFITINYQNTEALCEIQSFKQQPMKIIENPIFFLKFIIMKRKPYAKDKVLNIEQTKSLNTY